MSATRRRPALWLFACTLLSWCTLCAIGQDCREATTPNLSKLPSGFFEVTCEDGAARATWDPIINGPTLGFSLDYVYVYIQLERYNGTSLQDFETLSHSIAFHPANVSVNTTEEGISFVTIWACFVIDNQMVHINGTNHTCPEQTPPVPLPELTPSQTLTVPPTSHHLNFSTLSSATSSVLFSTTSMTSEASITPSNPAGTGAISTLYVTVIGIVAVAVPALLITAILLRRRHRNKGIEDFKFPGEFEIGMIHSDSQGSLVTQVEPVNLLSIKTCAFQPWYSSTATRKEAITVQRSFSSCSIAAELTDAELTHIDSETPNIVTVLRPLPQEHSGNSQAATSDQTQSTTISDYLQYPIPTAPPTSVDIFDSLSYNSESEDSLAGEIA